MATLQQVAYMTMVSLSGKCHGKHQTKLCATKNMMTNIQKTRENTLARACVGRAKVIFVCLPSSLKVNMSERLCVSTF